LSGEGAFLFNLKKCFDAECSKKKIFVFKIFANIIMVYFEKHIWSLHDRKKKIQAKNILARGKNHIPLSS
jgi:hypothetical protein